MDITRLNHYVPVWYQKRFLPAGVSTLFYLDFHPEKKLLSNGRIVTLKDCHRWGPKNCFKAKDLYTTLFFGIPNDEIERYLFGAIDQTGVKAVRALVNNDFIELHKLFIKFFEYLDAQKIRTPKGLDWIKTKYPRLSQLQLMLEMQHIRQMHCTMWVEAVREIISAEDSDIKFIITDHPVTIYNPACPPDSTQCQYPDDPSIALKGSQTIFPLDLNYCLILTNLEYAKEPHRTDLLTSRTNARYFGETIARFDTMIRSRKLKSENVIAINYLLKARARKFIAAANKEWLYPESTIREPWAAIGKVLVPPKNEIWHFGGEIYVGYKDGSTHYQDEFGRTVGDLPYLKKASRNGKIGPNELCVCGSGKKYKKCCRDKASADRSSTTEYSIRERNIMFFNAVTHILNLTKGKTWEDIRRELSDDQVKDIHNAFGCLWPKETNVVDLLPRPDQKVFRALYTGLIDPRTILRNVASFSPYFDEIIVLNPFMNPAYVKPEYSPIHSPSQYKQETLKNVLLLMQLIPFIEGGIVNLIPDPCTFNHSLRNQIWDMAQARPKHRKLDAEHMKPMEELCKDDFMRSMSGLPDESLKRHIKNSSPDLSDDKIEEVLDYMKRKRLEDPLALLQPITSGEKGGQVYITQLSPNLELGLFLAQITGSFIYTDNQHRWLEIIGAANNQLGGGFISPWEPLTKYMNSLDLTFEINPMANLRIRKDGRLGEIRSVLRKIFLNVQNEHDPARVMSIAQSLADELKEVHIKAQMEWHSMQKWLEQYASSGVPTFNFNGRIDCVIPPMGLGLNTVHRLLLSYGSIKYLKSVPMSIFFKTDR